MFSSNFILNFLNYTLIWFSYYLLNGFTSILDEFKFKSFYFFVYFLFKTLFSYHYLSIVSIWLISSCIFFVSSILEMSLSSNLYRMSDESKSGRFWGCHRLVFCDKSSFSFYICVEYGESCFLSLLLFDKDC